METGARDAYKNLKLLTDKIGTQFLKLTQILLPLRVACAGGKTPLPSDSAPVEDDSDNEDEEGAGKKKHKKRIVKFSDYAFQSKLKTLIEELKRVREEDSTGKKYEVLPQAVHAIRPSSQLFFFVDASQCSAKSLVFSQFGSTLKWIQEELPKHGFQFRTLSGDMPMRKRAKALLDFQNDPPTTVFLLSMRAGAVGINLTQANRVFLLEPCFNPALELQAIGRVHRLGQQRSVEIIRLVMQDSVESRMVEMLEKKHGKASTSDESDDDAVGTAPLVGNLQTDKVDMVEEELDLLFGVASGAEDLKTTTDLDGFKEEEAACTGGDEGSGVFAKL
jgi:SNF2 family DNA or RNA helicase